MTISKHADKFAGLPVKDFKPKGKPAKAKCVYRLAMEYEAGEGFAELLDQFLAKHGGPKLTALVIGPWHYEEMLESADEVVEALVGAKDRMPNLKALFVGDITYDECEMSWIQYGDVSPLLPAFPKLEEFRVRGASDLSFGKLKHANLKSFAIESGGLPERLLNEVWEANLPKLDHLELWLGTENYGGINTATPLKKLLSGKRFPKLKYLGLRNSAVADAVAKAVAKSPILKRLHTLDLSLGNIGDEGAKALLAAPDIKKLKFLDLHHNYITNAVLQELKKLKVKLDVSKQLKPDTYGEGEDEEEYRYITVSE
jgi:hypothetical protein